MTIKANNAWNKKPVYFNASRAGLVIWEWFLLYFGIMSRSLLITNTMLASSLLLAVAELELLGAPRSRAEAVSTQVSLSPWPLLLSNEWFLQCELGDGISNHGFSSWELCCPTLLQGRC